MIFITLPNHRHLPRSCGPFSSKQEPTVFPKRIFQLLEHRGFDAFSIFGTDQFNAQVQTVCPVPKLKRISLGMSVAQVLGDSLDNRAATPDI